MASLSRITATFFVTLINRLGVRPPPPNGFELISTVQPVSLVDSDITIPTQLTTALLDVPASTGIAASPAAGTVLADTGALPAGNYNIVVTIGINNAGAGTVGDFSIARRNAANNADVWAQAGSVALTGTNFIVFAGQVRLLLNERIRVVTITIATVNYQANIWQVLVQ
jgi:hypothetical protein